MARWVYSEFSDAPVWHNFEIDHDSKDQFTGLHDKNGKEIWEGDILSPGWNEGEVFIVRFDMMKARFCEQRHLIGNAICDYGYFMDGSMMRYEKYEVLGNVHTNSELLK